MLKHLIHSSLSCLLPGPSLPSPPQSSKTNSRHTNLSMAAASGRIAVVGDTHNDWELEQDSLALQFLQAILETRMLSLLEALQILNLRKRLYLEIMMLGTLINSLQRRRMEYSFNWSAYGRLDFPRLKLSVVGGRPFTTGGDQLFRKKLLSARYGIKNMDASAMKICGAAKGTPQGHSIIFLGHNGPKGLGSNTNDICGKDWVYEGGDHGDPDLAQAISLVKETTKHTVPLVVFGHMHKELRFGGLRKMIHIGTDDTIYLNGAVVPRVKRLVDNEGSSRAFTLVEISGGKIMKITETWVSVSMGRAAIAEEHVLYSRSSDA
ncbi:hypothetical protein AKJ16_DCAP00733 [Drosera capensis]